MRWTIRLMLTFAGLNLAWEVLQLPLYTLSRSSTAGEIAYAVAHCTAGDVLIGAAIAAVSWAGIKGISRGPSEWLFLGCFIFLALAYTVFSEWRNVYVAESWAYMPAMPLIPPFGTGLTPLLQWIFVPILTWITAGEAIRSKLAGRAADSRGPMS